ncbi:MAG: hypothetical protein HQL41_00835 [Alphaproteobacteria bacterium]|nr:hypothetical protein [Alphaproteobacteria bacterium]
MGIFTGSNRDKHLAIFVLVQGVARRLDGEHGVQLGPPPESVEGGEDVVRIEAVVGRQPLVEPNGVSVGEGAGELFRVLKAIAFSEERAASIKTLLANDSAALRSEYMERFETAFGSLEPLQKAVLIRLIEQGDKFAPFSGDSLAAYGRTMGEDPPNIPAVQKAIAGLREQGIVWQPARGDYVLEDRDMAIWFRSRAPGQLGVPAVDPDGEG